MTAKIITSDTINGAAYSFTPTQVEDLIVLPLLNESVAMSVSDVLRPSVGKTVELPIILDDAPKDATNADPGWVAEGAEIPLVSTPVEQALALLHHKIAARIEVPWERIADTSYDVKNEYGNSLVRRLVNIIDRAYFDEEVSAPVTGVGQLKGINEITTKGLKNTDALLDAIEHAANKGATVNTFVMAPSTLTKIAKLKRETGSEEPLLGVAENPGASTIAGVELKRSRWIKPDVIYAIPRDRMKVSLREDVQVKYDENSDFNRMVGGLIAYARISMGSIQPDAISKITIS
ncbi:hypothetical protein FRC0191_01883 [Corynebacterium diphtheriae]|uniref:phage major capsid protein n=1 Tax=Corynebacterium diphtheriae TaxID=1717 RepID=UPI0013C627B9|nr:phage major capsid protein [Corynebacterium diphtheriae]MBG9306410.1 phage major capsid protein [Corynebacterium diphtheriae bv. mitis]CAB0812194.1 hypothetical protein FRC0191_01883 [Corynebacterium diphtheriae]